LNIGIFTELFPPSVGGQEQRFAALADLLAMRGHRVTVLCVRYPTDAPATETLQSGVAVVRRPACVNYYKPLRGLLPRSPVGMVRFAIAARRLAKAQPFDAIFLNEWPVLHVLALPRRNRNRAIVDWCEIRQGMLFRFLQGMLPKLVAANTAVSTDVATGIRRTSGSPVVVIPSGIDMPRYRPAPEEHRRGILYVGRIVAHKNLLASVAVFEELCRRGYDEPLIIAGDGPDLDRLRDRIAASPFRANIKLAGHVSDERKVDLLAEAKVLLITSQREGFPRVVAEAMASGLPVVTARYPQNGTAAVVEEFGCGLCADPTPADLANAVQTVLGDWETWSAACRRRAPELDWSSLIQPFETLLRATAAAANETSFTRQPKGTSCESL